MSEHWGLRPGRLRRRLGQDLAAVLQALEISEGTYHRWPNRYGGMQAAEARRLKVLAGENARLKKLLAETELDKAILKEALERNY